MICSYIAAGCTFIIFVIAIFKLEETNPKVLKLSKLKKEKKQIMKSKISLGIHTLKREWLDRGEGSTKTEEDWWWNSRIEQARYEQYDKTDEIVPKNKKPKITWNVFMVSIVILLSWIDSHSDQQNVYRSFDQHLRSFVCLSVIIII